MPDEPTGTPSAETPGAPVEPTTTQPTPPTPQKLEGKTPEELMAILQDRDKVIGRQGQELGQLREAVERLYAERSQPRDDRPQGGEPREPGFKFDYEDPVKSLDEYFERKMSKERETTRKERMTDLGVRTTAAFIRGRETMKQNPSLYDGIEETVGNLVTAFYKPQFEQGIDVSHHLSDPGVWETAAIALRVRRGELDKLKPAARKGMTAEPADLPGHRPAQDDDGFIIEDSDRQEFEDLKGKKGTDKEIRELLKLGLGATKVRR